MHWVAMHITSCEFSAESLATTTITYSETASLSRAPDTTILPTYEHKINALLSLEYHLQLGLE